MPNLVIPGHNAGTTAEAYLLGSIAWARPDLLDSPEIRALAAKLCACVGRDGCILPPHTTKSRADSDLFPGVALFNLALYGLAIGDDLGLDWKTACAWYLQRARLIHPWRLMVWHAQVWNLVADLTGDLGYHEVAIELAEWMAARQLEVDGSFLSGMGTGAPGFDTAFSAEGIAAGWLSAIALGDEDRAQRFATCWQAAIAFTDRLLFRPEDTYWTAEPARVLGRVRSSLTGSSLQIDYTGHTLQALVGGIRRDEDVRGGPGRSVTDEAGVLAASLWGTRNVDTFSVVILEEFLAPPVLDRVRAYGLGSAEHFRPSRVLVVPGDGGVDTTYRNSPVLPDPAGWILELFGSELRRVLPNVLGKWAIRRFGPPLSMSRWRRARTKDTFEDTWTPLIPSSPTGAWPLSTSSSVSPRHSPVDGCVWWTAWPEIPATAQRISSTWCLGRTGWSASLPASSTR